MQRLLNKMRRKPLGALGLLIVVMLVFIAVFAPWLAPHDPIRPDFAAMLAAPGTNICWGRMNWAAICSAG